MSTNQLQFPKIGLPIIILGIIIIIFLSKSIVTIDAGEAGVLWKRFDDAMV
jgi:regulator of protease activity HflC (stomatin/prohibitin superfamily)